MRSEGRLKPCTGIIAGVVRIDACGIAECRGDSYLAGDGLGRDRNWRANIAGWRDRALIDYSHGVVVTKDDVLDRASNTASPDLLTGMIAGFGGVDQQRADSEEA